MSEQNFEQNKRFFQAYVTLEGVPAILACSTRSDSGARAKNKASERAGKNEGRLEREVTKAIEKDGGIGETV